MAYSNPVATDSSGLSMVDGVLWGAQWSDGTASNTRIAVYIAGSGANETFDFGGTSVSGRTVSQEAAAFRLASELISNVCNIVFSEVSSQSQADIIVAAVSNSTADGNLGIAVPPGEDTGPLSSQQGAVIVNRGAYASADYSSLLQGGYDFITFVHEFGHAVGLKHPHDTGGGVFPKFPGVTAAFDDYGDFNLNQGIYTMMSYNDGFPTGPLGTPLSDTMPDFGWEATPMAFDVAALQHMYGANMSFHTGDDVYTLPSANAVGTYFSCIWDAGGSDTIAAGSDTSCVIDLRAATLKVANGGGGLLSSQTGIFGGFTIANGAVIENATGGDDADKLNGNAAANHLSGLGGADKLFGSLGADLLEGGGGADDFIYTSLRDSSRAASDNIADFLAGVDGINLHTIDANRLTAGINDDFDFIGTDMFSNTAGELRYQFNSKTGDTVIAADLTGDGIPDFRIVLDGQIGLAEGDFIL